MNKNFILAKKYRKNFYYSRFFDDPPPSNDPPPPPPPPAPDKKFTQDDVNRFLKQDRDRAKKENETLLGQLQKLRDEGLTPEARQELESRIQQIEDAGKTQDQLRQEEISKWEKKYNKDLSAKDETIKTWQNRYQEYRFNTDVVGAATSKDVMGENVAYNPSQIVSLLRPHMYFAEEVGEDGKPTGELIPRVKLPDIKDNKPTVLDLTVTEAVKRMKDMDSHKNLFHSGATGGLGGGNLFGGNANNFNPNDTKAFMEKYSKEGSKLFESIKG
jgi:hypothetical protein